VSFFPATQLDFLSENLLPLMRTTLAPINTRIIVTRYGGPEALQVIQEERPEPKPDEAQSMQLQLVAVWGVLVIINEKNKQAP
jgi:hypothetical protein